MKIQEGMLCKVVNLNAQNCKRLDFLHVTPFSFPKRKIGMSGVIRRPMKHHKLYGCGVYYMFTVNAKGMYSNCLGVYHETELQPLTHVDTLLQTGFIDVKAINP